MTVNQRLDDLHARGFDASYPLVRDDYGRFTTAIRVKCSQCEALAINGLACHEIGCRNSVRDRDEDYDDEV